MKALISLSGGLDSSVVMWWMHSQGYNLQAFTVNYGQVNAQQEIAASINLCSKLNIKLDILSLSAPHLKLSQNILTNPCASSITSIVPARNMILASLGTSIAINIHAHLIAFGFNKADHDEYIDCRPSFIEKIDKVAQQFSVRIFSPLSGLDKKSIFSMAQSLDVPIKLCWSCYRNGVNQCGKCQACLKNLAASNSRSKK